MSVRTEVVTGTYTGHSAAIYLGLGFMPAFFLSINVGDAAYSFFTKDMTALTGVVNDDGTPGALSAGYTLYAGGDVVSSASDAYQDGQGNQIAAGLTVPAGILIGTDEDINTDGETFYFVAIGTASAATAANTDYTDESHN